MVYDVQRIKFSENTLTAATLLTVSIYLDILNLFLSLINLFGGNSKELKSGDTFSDSSQLLHRINSPWCDML